jgi:hypothetical protein
VERRSMRVERRVWDVVLPVPADGGSATTIVAFVQNPINGDVLQALALPVSPETCAARLSNVHLSFAAQNARMIESSRRWLRKLGPGLITGAADDDPSGIATYSQAGAQFGYQLGWTSC